MSKLQVDEIVNKEDTSSVASVSYTHLRAHET